jgi:ArsR family transcriptional regulator
VLFFVRGAPLPSLRPNRRNLEAEIIDRQVQICKAFAHATRLQMLDMLAQREWPVAALQAELGVSKANLSQHVTILKSAGIVVTRRQGRQVYCSLAMPEVKAACKLIRDVLRAQVRNDQLLAV